MYKGRPRIACYNNVRVQIVLGTREEVGCPWWGRVQIFADKSFANGQRNAKFAKETSYMAPASVLTQVYNILIDSLGHSKLIDCLSGPTDPYLSIFHLQMKEF